MNLANLRALVTAHAKQVEYGLLALIIFGAGWQLGRIMSPYYAAAPIIFQETAGNIENGSPEALQALQEEGRTLQEASLQRAEQVAGAQSGEAISGEFVASVNSDLYHHASCPSVSRIKEENRVWFTSTAEAEAAGFSPSKCTQDKFN